VLLAAWTPTDTIAFDSPPSISQFYFQRFVAGSYHFPINLKQLKAFLGSL